MKEYCVAIPSDASVTSDAQCCRSLQGFKTELVQVKIAPCAAFTAVDIIHPSCKPLSVEVYLGLQDVV